MARRSWTRAHADELRRTEFEGQARMPNDGVADHIDYAAEEHVIPPPSPPVEDADPAPDYLYSEPGEQIGLGDE